METTPHEDDEQDPPFHVGQRVTVNPSPDASYKVREVALRNGLVMAVTNRIWVKLDGSEEPVILDSIDLVPETVPHVGNPAYRVYYLVERDYMFGWDTDRDIHPPGQRVEFPTIEKAQAAARPGYYDQRIVQVTKEVVLC